MLYLFLMSIWLLVGCFPLFWPFSLVVAVRKLGRRRDKEAPSFEEVRMHGDYPDLDYEWVHEQFKRKGVTRTPLYGEYCDSSRAFGSGLCSVTTFNSGYAEWGVSQCLIIHIDLKPDQKMEIDWAGTKIALADLLNLLNRRFDGRPLRRTVLMAAAP